MRDRTKQGLILERILHNLKGRYLLCWKGPRSAADFWGGDCYDCACCITYFNSQDTQDCGCPCHSRIEAMANTPEMLYFLLALDNTDEIPFTPKDYADWMRHNRKIFAKHEEWRAQKNPSAEGDCCEACKMVRDMEAKYADHQNAPNKDQCGTPCHICDEHRAARKRRGK